MCKNWGTISCQIIVRFSNEKHQNKIGQNLKVFYFYYNFLIFALSLTFGLEIWALLKTTSMVTTVAYLVQAIALFGLKG